MMIEKLRQLVAQENRLWALKRDKELLVWIDEQTKHMSFDGCKLNTKVWWLLNDVKTYDDKRAKCKQCSTPFIGKNVRSVNEGYAHEFCSQRCAKLSEETQRKYEETCLKKFGVTEPHKSKTFIEKCMKQFEEKHGGRTPMQAQDTKKLYVESMMKKHNAPSPFACKAIKDKAKKTCLQKFGSESAFCSKDVQKKSKETCLAKYGVDNAMKLPKTYQKVIQSAREHFNVPDDVSISSTSQIPEVAQKIHKAKAAQTSEEKIIILEKHKKTCLKKFGYDNALKCPEVRQKAYATMEKRFGYRYPSQCPDIQKTMHGRYQHDGIMFDSLPELAYYVWLKDNAIQFQFHPDVCFEYECFGKKHLYFPDFLVEGQLVELKGDHFFDEHGNMTCPYRNPDWDDMKYAEMCEMYEAKHQCMKMNGVKIMKSADYDMHMKHLKKKFRNNAVSMFKRHVKSVAQLKT